MNNPKWQPATLPAREPEDPMSVPYLMTKNDRDQAQLVRLDIIAQTRRAKLNEVTPGFEVKELSPFDLSDAELAALGIGEAE